MNSNLLQARLDQIQSPSDSKAEIRSPDDKAKKSPSIGYGTQQYREYDNSLAQLEAECRGHIKCEQ
jgi:hypothetical protein